MKSIFTILSAIAFSATFLFGQDIKIKRDMVYLDGIEQFKLESLQLGNTVNIYNKEGEKLIVYRYQSYNDKDAITSGNPNGTISWYEVTFLNENMDKCEVDLMMKKGLAKEIISNNLVQDGQLNEASVKQFIVIHGMNYSAQRKSPSTTIIINNN
ncbi:MAG: hypothetical protein WC994_04595 [Brumimicrobium sp.]